MNGLRKLLWVAAAFGVVEGADTGTTHQQAILLNRVRAHMQSALSTLPNYTCLETIERVHRRPKSKRFDLVDTVRLEVALVNGKELFSWPGEKKFDDREISEIVKGGAIGNGSFALHAKSIFQSNSARFDFIGERIREGRRTLRWDYDVAQFQSGYTLRVGERKGVVGYRGSFWVDEKSLDLIRLEVEATGIPPFLEILETKDFVEYERMKIGQEEYLLPKLAELRMHGLDDSESVNRTRFTGCRQYTGESTLIFTDPAETTVEQKTPEPLIVPAGMSFESELATPIASGESAIGDPVTLRVTKDRKRDGAVVLPKDTLLHGRITLLRRQNTDRAGYVLGLDFTEAEHGNRTGPIRLRLERVAVNDVSLPGEVLSAGNRRVMVEPEAAPGATMFIKGSAFKMSRGVRLYWRTISKGEDKQ